MLSSVQGKKCEFMPNRMFKCRVAQGCAGTVKGKWSFFNAEMVDFRGKLSSYFFSYILYRPDYPFAELEIF